MNKPNVKFFARKTPESLYPVMVLVRMNLKINRFWCQRCGKAENIFGELLRLFHGNKMTAGRQDSPALHIEDPVGQFTRRRNEVFRADTETRRRPDLAGGHFRWMLHRFIIDAKSGTRSLCDPINGEICQEFIHSIDSFQVTFMIGPGVEFFNDPGCQADG